MLYLKHSEVVNTYHVSLSTVHNWITAAKNGKLNLKLYEKGSRTYIGNSSENERLLEQLAEKGKKKRNNLHHKIAKPIPAFYELYSQQQIYDIITNLRVHNEIPRQYNYFDGGASYWDEFANRLWQETAPNIMNGTIDLLRHNQDSIDQLLEGYKKVNVVDLGLGNALPVKELLAHLLEKQVLNRYIAVDISEEMLSIAKRNIDAWYSGKVKFEGYVKDITHERFGSLLVPDMLAKDGNDTVNLVLLLGGTLTNFRSWSSTLSTIYGSMGQNDLFIYTDKLDTDAARRYFLLNNDMGANALSSKYSFIFNMLNIDKSTYDVEMGFNEAKRMRFIKVRFRQAITIQFEFEGAKQEVTFDKGEQVLLWRAWHKTSQEITSEFENAGFDLLQTSTTKNRQFLLTVAGIDQKIIGNF